jgi:hypothetical protein
MYEHRSSRENSPSLAAKMSFLTIRDLSDEPVIDEPD